MNDQGKKPADAATSSPNDYKRWLQSKWPRRRAFWTGILFANLAGVLTMLFAGYVYALTGHSGRGALLGGTYLISQFVAIPVGMGIVASFFWRRLSFSLYDNFVGAILVVSTGIALCYFVLHEGVICLIMAAPLLFIFIWLGVALGQMLWKRNPWLGASTLPLVVFLLATDAQMPHHHAAIVTDQVLIRAAPATVWRYVPEYPAMTAPPDYWLWKIGLPIPTQSTATGAFVGAKRDCRFSGNVVFEEKIVEAETAKVLTFDVTKQPDHPELTGHFNLDRGRFLLRDNGDGTTTLIGTTWYRLHVYPAPYFDLWAADIVRRVHFRVMNHIKALAERDARAVPRRRHRILTKR